MILRFSKDANTKVKYHDTNTDTILSPHVFFKWYQPLQAVLDYTATEFELVSKLKNETHNCQCQSRSKKLPNTIQKQHGNDKFH